MKIKTSELTGAALDWAVAKCEGLLDSNGRLSDEYCDSLKHDQDGSFSTDWSQGGPIIEREKIGYCWSSSGYWQAHQFDPNDELNSAYYQEGPTPLIAAMRCLVASKLGDEVEVPDELA